MDIVLDVEHEEEAVRVGYGIHSDNNPLAHRLVGVLFTQGRADLGWTLLKAQLQGMSIDCIATRTSLEAQLAARHEDQAYCNLVLADRRFVEDLAGVGTDFTLACECLAILLGRLVETELDGFPDLEPRNEDLLLAP